MASNLDPFDKFNDGEYTPRSPNMNSTTFDNHEPESLHPQHQTFRGSVSHHSPFSPTGSSHDFFARNSFSGYSSAYKSQAQSSVQLQSSPRSLRLGMVKHEPEDDEYEHRPPRGRGRGKNAKTKKIEETEAVENLFDMEESMMPTTAATSGSGGIEVKTKFPVARIKRIMQADEDVGKVAQVTPVAVCESLDLKFHQGYGSLPISNIFSNTFAANRYATAKALELFMIALVTKSAVEARSRNSKRVLPGHLKTAVMADEQFDFLNDIVSKVPDPALCGSRSQAEDSDEADVKVGKKRGRRRKIESDL